jgi:predicted amidohydrolase
MGSPTLKRRVWNEGIDKFMQVICCQHDIAWEDRDANLARVGALLRGGEIPKGSLVLLPEMFTCGFSLNTALIADSAARETEGFLECLAAELGVYLMGGVVNLDGAGMGRNEAVVYSPAGVEVSRYCKMRPFAPGGEAAHFAAGTAPVIFDWAGCSVAPFICYDLRFPEIQRQAGARRAQLMTFIASWPDARLSHWVTLLQARAIENQCYVAGVNRIGSDPNLHYSGRSIIVSPSGEIIADAGDRECLIRAELDLEALHDYRSRLPFLDDLQDFGLRKS